jgi:hypothetical protein
MKHNVINAIARSLFVPCQANSVGGLGYGLQLGLKPAASHKVQ